MTLRALPLLVLGACATRVHHVPELKAAWSEGPWVVEGRVRTESCAIYILAVDWPHLFADQRARVDGAALRPPWSRVVPEERRALYDAMQRLPDATHVLAPRGHVETVGVSILGRPLFGERCAAVDVTGVRLGASAAPSAETSPPEMR
ncbi:MAG: hypothetical protein H6735_17890 [Alphaproteobacteria bacterium]|nr:hypothetical protein [Alphaproteobacteria bacterium]